MLFRSNAVDWLIVGLGNPGKKYENTHHNAGFLAIDHLAERLGVKITRSKFDALTAIAELGGSRVLLMKPQTYMNLSGQAVYKAASFYKIPPERVLVLYDDISLAPGKLRIRLKGSAGGHNGIKSIIGGMGDEFARIKIGVGERTGGEADLADFVLARFSKASYTAISARFDDVCDAAALIIKGDTAAAMNQYNS